jgi:hypothetical protein
VPRPAADWPSQGFLGAGLLVLGTLKACRQLAELADRQADGLGDLGKFSE